MEEINPTLQLGPSSTTGSGNMPGSFFYNVEDKTLNGRL